MSDVTTLREEFNQAHLAERRALDKKVEALIELQLAEDREQPDVSVEGLRYVYACSLWEMAYRHECRVLRRYNEAMQAEIEQDRRGEGGCRPCLSTMGGF